MKIVTVLGTRPEIIRLSRVIAKLDAACQHVLVHTGQNFDAKLSDIFFDELGVRRPDKYLSVGSSSFAEQVGSILRRMDEVLAEEKPDRLLILGDTNSGLSAYIAKRRGIPVYHMEAGNRCYDDRVPEEVNRRVIDHSSDVLMPYTERSRANLLREGIASDRIFVTGNPIAEVLRHYEPAISASTVGARLAVDKKGFFLVTLHRAENVDDESRLRAHMRALEDLQVNYNVPVVCSVHPRLRDRLQKSSVSVKNSNVKLVEPLGFFDFVWLEMNALCVLTDSGTVQEECCIFHVPNVTLRDVTERPETMECGSNILAGADPAFISSGVKAALASSRKWVAPVEYLADDVSDTVVKIVLSYRHQSLPRK